VRLRPDIGEALGENFVGVGTTSSGSKLFDVSSLLGRIIFSDGELANFSFSFGIIRGVLFGEVVWLFGRMVGEFAGVIGKGG
jgi:hypothetical protein